MHTLRQLFHGFAGDQRGEGVISTAIAVLIMAVIGAVMYAAFSGTFNTAQGEIDDRISEIGEG
jgi:Flp pilus assembly protein TadG